MSRTSESLVNSDTRAISANNATQMDEGYFLIWVAIWIIALAILLPALM